MNEERTLAREMERCDANESSSDSRDDRSIVFNMEEHGMVVEKSVDVDERSEHERFLRLAISVREER